MTDTKEKAVPTRQSLGNENIKSLTKKIIVLQEQVSTLSEEVLDLKERLDKREVKGKNTINKYEGFNGVTHQEPREDSKIYMKEHDRIQSMKNACKILPPNKMVDGRHVASNVAAICGFQVDEEMLDLVYENKEEQACVSEECSDEFNQTCGQEVQ